MIKTSSMISIHNYIEPMYNQTTTNGKTKNESQSASGRQLLKKISGYSSHDLYVSIIGTLGLILPNSYYNLITADLIQFQFDLIINNKSKTKQLPMEKLKKELECAFGRQHLKNYRILFL
jgi:hypothetical protein